ncbi:unnamed protein product [Clonostachys rosea f. rosea IK726]|uniref:Heterokaryon incompatibility domain-containing protein n=2 Tax=Bionectria ochroleuca TaxID=29856 RepID=A0A0B7JSE7_BIOOC|nr:unnamed protein product [Clonostachys rosea f. rosea IK726]
MAGDSAGSQMQFPRLDPEKAEIRVLEIQSGDKDSPLECKYHIANLTDLNLTYEALSYAWGTPHTDNDRLLKIDNGHVQITSTLLDAIQNLRLPDRNRFMWIDALCINQADDEEKTVQVDMMDQIYSKCEQSVVWLGHLGDVQPTDAEAVFDLIFWVAGEQEEPSWTGDSSRSEFIGQTLKKFMHLPWWYRIWTVQETILPSKATLLWGHLSIDRTTLYKAADTIFDDDCPNIPIELFADNAMNDLTSSMRGLSFSQDERLLQLFVRWRFRHATDPRDKVYGLMGFREDLSLPTVKSCDYTIDVRTLFKRITADLIRAEGSLLPLIGRRGETSDLARQPEGFPSWVFDWVEPVDPSHKLLEYWKHEACWYWYDFTPDAGLYGVGDGLKMIGEDILCLCGLYVDKVAVVERPDNDRSEADHGSEMARSLSVVERWEEVVERFQREWPGVLRRGWVRELCSVAAGRFAPDQDDTGTMADYHYEMVQGQSLFITEGGKFGIGPKNAQPGHEVWVVGGSRLPFLLSPVDSTEGASQGGLDFTLFADCLVYGVMYGEAVEGRGHEQVEFRLH